MIGALAAIMVAPSALAQPPMRRATTVEAIRGYPGFFHTQPVVVVGRVTSRGEHVSLATDNGALRLVSKERPDEGAAEVRGVVYDIGRMNSDDPRLVTLELRDLVQQAYGDRWPRPGEELVLHVTSGAAAPAVAGSTLPSLRRIALEPERYAGQKVSVIGQFRGRNLYADLPEAPTTSERHDFVLRSLDAALWVTGVRPRGPTFNFETTRRVDTGRWVRVAGTVRAGRGLAWLEGTSIELADAPSEDVAEPPAPPPPPPPLDVVFSSPREGEADVRLDASIRLQLSRDLDPGSLKDRIRLAYSRTDSAERGEPQPPAIAFTINYTPVNRGLEIRPTEPLERFRQIRLELIEGVRGPDGALLKPFTLSFSTGGS